MSAAKTPSIYAIFHEDGVCGKVLAAEWEPEFELLAEPWLPCFPPGFLESVEGGEEVAFVRVFVFVVEIFVFARWMSLTFVIQCKSGIFQP